MKVLAALPLTLATISAAAGLSWGWEGVPGLAILSFVMPACFGLATSRAAASAVVLVYYLAASRGLPIGTGIFFAEAAPAWFGWALWCGAGLVNSAAWACLWHSESRRRAAGSVAALFITALPPIGIIGWTNPLAAAGWLYPSAGFIGVALASLLVASLAGSRWSVSASLIAAAIAANLAHQLDEPSGERNAPNWSAQNTHFPALQSDSLGQFHSRLQYVLDAADSIAPGHVLVMPETILPIRSKETAFAWSMLDAMSDQLRERGSVLLAGAEVKLSDGKLLNAIIPFGESEPTPLAQRVPVPIGMWRPWADDGFKSDLAGHGMAIIGDHDIAYFICYEQLLIFPFLRSLPSKPTILVGTANNWWARNTSIPAVQSQSIGSWGRLFSIPVIAATNL